MSPTVKTTMSDAKAKPACCVAVPGRPSNCVIAMGNVVEFDRVRNDVAPNSPSEIAMARPEARRRAGRTMGNSTVAHVRIGVLPRVDAACRKD